MSKNKYAYYRWKTFGRGEVWRITSNSAEFTNKFKQQGSAFGKLSWSSAGPKLTDMIPIPDLTLILLGYK